MFFKKTKKIVVSALLVAFSFISISGFLVSAQPAQAQLGVAVLTDIQSQAKQIWDMIRNTWKIAVMNAAQQAVSYFLRKVAYDSAVYIASGGKGQNPFAQTSGMYDYLSNVGGAAVGTAIDSLGTGWGLDLCKIPDFKLDLALRVGLNYNYGAAPPTPKCDWNKLAANWSGDAWKSRYEDPSKTFSGSLKVDDTDLGVTLKATEKLDRLYLTQTDSAKAQNIQNQGFKDFTGLVDGRIKTPASVIQQEAKANTPSQQNAKSEAQVGYAMGSGAYEIIPSTLSLFLNTLSSQMLKNFKEKGMLPFGSGCVEIPGVTGQKCPTVTTNAGSAGTELMGRAVAQATFNDFLKTTLLSADNYDVLSQLRSCPDQRGLYNCRIDEQFVNALNADRNDHKPVTIQEALTNGWLQGAWRLIPPTNVLLNTDAHCYDGHYCYSNLQVLRQLGILPIGMEIAALHSPPDTPRTLQQVVDGFYNCPKPDLNGKINYDPINFPYCHLVDPNWVIKLPDTRCGALGYTAMPLDGTSVPDRIQDCVDIKTCISKDTNNNCISYANCIRSKNVWNFEGDICKPQNSTCRAFTDSNNNQVAYLYRTLDTGSCDQSTVGCNGYSLQKDSNGDWSSITTTTASDNYTTGVYLNKNITTCDPSAAGCSAFKIANPTSTGPTPQLNISNNLAYLKKAPDYLHCYDVSSTAGIQWPQNFADLTKLESTKNPACSNYAPVCIADEIGCSNFTNIGSPQSTPVPAKFTPATLDSLGQVQQWNDQCDKKCVGYAAYQEMPTNFSAGNSLAYIIPPSDYNDNSSGTVCDSTENGCSAFTNMETTANGGEKAEYFTDLRACIKPNPDQQKNYFTYEGSSAGGFQLKSYTLKKNTTVDEDLTKAGIQTGGPEMALFTTDDFKKAADCNEQVYKATLAPFYPGDVNNDCRQFNDDQGNVYYALLSHTVVVSPDCTQYRLDSENPLANNTCLGNGQYKNGSCYYFGLPKDAGAFGEKSTSCNEDKVSCRGYKGNHSNNISPLVTDNFGIKDPTTANSGWSSTNGTLAYSTESVKANGHSLGFAGNANAVLERGSINIAASGIDILSDTALSMDFWAKGTGEAVEIKLVDTQTGTDVTVGSFVANNTWRTYKFEPIQWPYAGLAKLSFKLVASGNLYIDNINLNKVTELTYLLKNSLKVDSICDDTPDDNLPGAALGCTAYSGPKNTLNTLFYYLTNFSYLCRDGAIGCTAYIDTFNKPADSSGLPGPSTPVAYNVWLPGAGGNNVSINLGNTPPCQIAVGQSGCFVTVHGFDKATIIGSAVQNSGLGTVYPQFLASTYYLPSDKDSLSYLVYNDQSLCEPANSGCTYAGVQKNSLAGTSFETTTILLDSSKFDTVGSQNGTMCSAQAVGCGDFNGSYFKDPVIAGSKICSFGNFISNGAAVQGWYRKDVGTCSNDITKYCTSGDDCGTGNTCGNKNTIPCYTNNYKNAPPIGQFYDLWSYGNTSTYKNFVGECPVEEDKCSEYVDHNDNDKPYYYIKNDKITVNDCAGQVSQKAGCVSFDETSNPSKYWSTVNMYKKSDGYLYNPNDSIFNATKVQPTSDPDPANNDANVVIKVTRDRECGEWLQCNGSTGEWNTTLKKMDERCTSIGLCDKLSSVTNSGGKEADCADFVDGQNNYAGKVLSENLYVQREVTWSGQDLTGLSILGSYPLNEIEQYNVASGTQAAQDIRLLKRIPCGGGDNCKIKSASSTSVTADNSSDCIADNLLSADISCGANGNGQCIKGLCFQTSFGQGGSTDDVKTDSITTDCRAFPEKDSPFPSLLAFTGNQNFNGVAKCSEANDPRACDCSYSKATYGNKSVTQYFKTGNPVLTGDNNGYCMGGTRDAHLCNPTLPATSTCANTPAPCMACPGGSCLNKDSKVEILSGWTGYCLEQDQSRVIVGTSGSNLDHPCLTWLPIDAPVGQYKDSSAPGASITNQLPVSMKYCLAADVYDSGPKYYHTWFDDDTHLIWADDSSCQQEFNALKDSCGSTGYPSGTNYPTGKTYLEDCNTYKSLCAPGYNIDTVTANVQEHGGRCSTVCNPGPDFIAGYWYLHGENSWIPFDDTQVGCSLIADFSGVFTNPDVQISPWANRLWKGIGGGIQKPSYVVDPSKITSTPFVGYAFKLNYNIDSHPTSTYFAHFENDLTADTPIKLNACRHQDAIGGIQFTKPNSQGVCDDQNTAWTYNNQISPIFSYDPWLLTWRKSGISCTIDSYCNQVTGSNNPTCNNHSAVAPVSQCTYSCGTIDKSSGKLVADNSKCTKAFNSAASCAAVIDPLAPPTASPKMYLCTSTSALPVLSCSPVSGNTCESANFVCNGTCNNTPPNTTPKQCISDDSCYTKYCDITPPATSGECKDMVISQSAPITDVDVASRTADAVRLLTQIFAKIPTSSLKQFFLHNLFESPFIVKGGNVYSNANINQYKNLPLDVTGITNETHIGDPNNYEKHVPSDHVPFIHPVGECNDKGACVELPNEGFTVNDHNPANSQDNVLITSKPFPIIIKYFYGVDPEHMPARRVLVDFDDPSNFAAVKSYPDLSLANYRGYVSGNSCVNGSCNYIVDGQTVKSGENNCKTNDDCAKSLFPVCVASTNAPAFSYIIDQACIPTYDTEKFNYNCTQTDSNYHSDCTIDWFNGNKDQYDIWRDPVNGFGLTACCVYRPKIQILDNWGWCNGVCRDGITGGNDVTNRCYDGLRGTSGWNECSEPFTYTSTSTNAHSNTIYGANVIVAPNIKKTTPIQ